jgi:hypothetical protein
VLIVVGLSIARPRPAARARVAIAPAIRDATPSPPAPAGNGSRSTLKSRSTLGICPPFAPAVPEETGEPSADSHGPSSSGAYRTPCRSRNAATLAAIVANGTACPIALITTAARETQREPTNSDATGAGFRDTTVDDAICCSRRPAIHPRFCRIGSGGTGRRRAFFRQTRLRSAWPPLERRPGNRPTDPRPVHIFASDVEGRGDSRYPACFRSDR